MPEIIEYSTCSVCLQLRDRTVYYAFPDGLEFEICLACLQSAQQMFAPDTACAECQQPYPNHSHTCSLAGS